MPLIDLNNEGCPLLTVFFISDQTCFALFKLKRLNVIFTFLETFLWFDAFLVFLFHFFLCSETVSNNEYFRDQSPFSWQMFHLCTVSLLVASSQQQRLKLISS